MLITIITGLAVCKGLICVDAGKPTESLILGLEAETPLNFQGTKSGHGNASRPDPPTILFYSDWSSWSICNERCEKTRQRRCLNPQKCGNIVLKETDMCPLNGDKRNRRKCQCAQNRRKHRHKTDEFHVIRVSTSGSNRQSVQKSSPHHQHSKTTTSSRQSSRRPPEYDRRASHLQQPSSFPNYNPQQWHDIYSQWTRPNVNNRYYHQTTPNPFVHPSGYSGWASYMQPSIHQRESSVIFPSSGMSSNRGRPNTDRLTAYESKLYGKWSRWSQCTRSCTTHRRRNCKRRDLCGNTILKESAYCYVEDSYCQRWIQRKMQLKDEAFENEAIQDHTYPESGYSSGKRKTSTQIHSGKLEKEVVNGSPEEECGIAGNATKSVGNMLRIIGGRPTTKGRWPWQVAVLNRFREAFCGGTLISSRWVITAAHCLRKRLYVRIGEHDLSQKDGTEIELRIDQMVRHPSYDEETVDNDVALLHLPVPVHPGKYRGLACLPKPRQMLPSQRYCTIIGWGKRISSDTFGTDILHEAEVPIVSNDICRNVYEDYHITGNMFCAGYRRGRMDSCAGDSGGPLLCKEGDRWTIFGITSFGEGCGKHGKYGIYTRLPNFVKWIQKTIEG